MRCMWMRVGAVGFIRFTWSFFLYRSVGKKGGGVARQALWPYDGKICMGGSSPAAVAKQWRDFTYGCITIYVKS